MTKEPVSPYKMNLPTALKQRIEDAAHRNRRSISAEIIATLEREYPEPTDTLKDAINDIRKILDEYEKETDPRKRLELQKLVQDLTSGRAWLF